MTQQQKAPFVIFSGIISDLQIVNDERDFILNSELKSAGKGAAAGLAIAGVAGAAATALQSSVGAESEVQLFRCKLGDKLVTGCFSRVFFDNNEEVDIVAEPKEDGSYYAYSVRRPIDHRLWLPLYCERGTEAHKKANIFLATWSASIISLLSFIFAILWGELLAENDIRLVIKYLLLAIISNVILFVFLFLCILSLLKGLTKYSQLAEKIFITWGYNNPERFDMNKENRQFLEDCKQSENVYCLTDTKQFQQILVAPCVYHYREAPEIPESSKLK